MSSVLDRQTEDLFQSGSLLPEQYGSQLDPECMRADVFYALSEIFTFTATSEKQFLNFMEKLIKQETYLIREGADFSITNLKNAREILDDHSQRLEETVRFLGGRGSSRWPTTPETQGKAAAAREVVLEDFEYLLELCRSLSQRCLEGVTLITNDAVLEESRKAMKQSEQTNTLTRLAFFYLPLTLVTGVFGMNFREFGQGSLSIWIGMLVCAGLLAVQALLYYFRWQLSRLWHAFQGYEF